MTHNSNKREIETLVEEQNKRFQVICSSKNDAIITSDETKKILFWNKGAEYIFGYTSEEAIGQPMTLIIPKELHQRHNEGIDRMNHGMEPRVLGKVLELQAIRKGGEEFPIELTLGSWDNNGKRYYCGIIRDITEKKKAELIILDEKKKSEELLLNILPKQVADELKSSGKAITKIYENVTIIFTDGDAYFAACGVPEKNENHASQCIEAGKQMLKYLEERNTKNEIQWKMRVGIHSGAVVAGVVGKMKYAYDLFGDTVNTASRMESNGEVGKINISETAYNLIEGKYNCIPRGEVNVKGKGNLKMYFVE